MYYELELELASSSLSCAYGKMHTCFLKCMYDVCYVSQHVLLLLASTLE